MNGKVTKATILFSLKMVARYLTEKRRFEPQNTVKVKCSQLSCDQPPQLLVTVTLDYLPLCKNTIKIGISITKGLENDEEV